MLEFQKTKKKLPWFYSKFILLGFVILLILFIKAVWGILEKEKESRINLKRVEAELENLEERESLLLDSIPRLKTERGIEEEIRAKFQVAKEGEELYIILDDTEYDSVESPVQENVFGKIIKWFRRD